MGLGLGDQESGLGLRVGDFAVFSSVSCFLLCLVEFIGTVNDWEVKKT